MSQSKLLNHSPQQITSFGGELLKVKDPVGRAERVVTQQNKVQVRKIEKEMPSGTLLEDELGNIEFMTKLLEKIFGESFQKQEP